MSTDAGLEHDPVIRVPRGQRQILYLILTDRSADIRSRWIKYRSAAADFDRRAHRTQLERAVHHCFTACLEDDFSELERGEPVLHYSYRVCSERKGDNHIVAVFAGIYVARIARCVIKGRDSSAGHRLVAGVADATANAAVDRF